jgi:hypothetical protein
MALRRLGKALTGKERFITSSLSVLQTVNISGYFPALTSGVEYNTIIERMF